MVKAIFKLFRKQFIALATEDLFHSQRKHADKFAGWKVAFIDRKGMKYYIPETELDMPIQRLGVFSRYFDFLNTCISPNEVENICNAIDKTLDEVRSSPKMKGLAKIQVITEQLREFLKHPVHEELYFRIACTFYVREDESPAEWDMQIEEEKYQQLKEDSKAGLYDFFYRTPLKAHFDLYGITEQNLTQYLKSSEVRMQEMKSIWQALELSPEQA